jgi:hypothetical protein
MGAVWEMSSDASVLMFFHQIFSVYAEYFMDHLNEFETRNGHGADHIANAVILLRTLPSNGRSHREERMI